MRACGVVCNEAPRFKVLSPDRVEFVQWSPEAEVAAVQSATVGLMPMPDNDWARGKCSFKMLTYLACGVPAVASPWGMNQQVIQGGGAIGAVSEKEWFDAITSLLKDRKSSPCYGCGRAGAGRCTLRLFSAGASYRRGVA